MRKIQNLKHSTSKDPAKREAKKAEISQAHREYIEKAQDYLTRARVTRAELEEAAKSSLMLSFTLKELDEFISHAERQIDQTRRRVLEGETIPHDEKVFSLFEPHTEWIVKGKAGVPVELGLAVAVVEDQNRFILNHRVLEKTTDSEVAVPLIEETRERFGPLKSASFDKGFHSPANQDDLKELVGRLVLPKKGHLSAEERELQMDPEFVRLRRQHSAVESAINALEQHGLDRCLDEGIHGFKRYVALAVVSRNVLRVGQVLRQQELELLRKRSRFRRAA
jgi:transposase, IS5 family